MSIVPEDLQVDSASKPAIPQRIEPRMHGGSQPAKFAAVAAASTLALATPVAFNDALDAWVAWDPNTGASSAADEVQTLTATGTVSGGTYALTFDGQTTAAIAYNANAAAIEAALDLLSTVPTGAISVSGGALPGTPAVFTFDGAAFTNADVPLIVVDDALLTGTAPVLTMVETTEGTPGTGAPAGQIRGFVFPTAAVLSTTGETYHVIMMKGAIHHDDVVLPTAGAPTQSQLDDALRTLLTEQDILVTGLAGIR